MNTDRREGWNRTWAAIALIWALLLCFVPDPRPLATPAWSIQLVRSVLHVQDPAARVIAAIALGMFLLGVLGVLLMLASGSRRLERRSLIVLLAAPVLGLVTLWINRGYFPIPAQIKLAVVATLVGALAALVLRRNGLASILLVALLGCTYWMLSSYDVSDDLDRATRDQVKQLLRSSDQVPDGDEGFVRLTTSAFDLAAERSANSDPVLENQAAILALALVLGDEKLASLADRALDRGMIPRCDSLRARLTLHDRGDWSRHFWVSAGLRVLSGTSRTMSVGVIKELKDANAGGSGFSFGDLTADAAGERFAEAVTRGVDEALAAQQRSRASLDPNDVMPDAHDLPEGIHADEFQETYGGVGGARTDSLVRVIEARLDQLEALR